MPKKAKRERDGLVHLDAVKLQRRALSLGLSKTAIADSADVSRNTVYSAFNGKGIFPGSAKLIAEAVGVGVESLLDNGCTTNDTDGATELIVGEWSVTDFLTPWVTTSNGLQFRVCEMQHRFIEDRKGRGKWYDLLGRDREKWKDHLLRHPSVCERMAAHPNIANNISAQPGSNDESWWVVDRWIDGQALSDKINGSTLSETMLVQCMTHIADGLIALHGEGIVFRELSPSRVVIRNNDGRAVLTDFELAKLTDGAPTVSADWPDSPYQAPEVASGSADKRSDIYSWARIFLHAATGQLPPKGLDLDVLAGVSLPKGVWKSVSLSLSPAPSERPTDFKAIMRVLNSWAKSLARTKQ